MGTPDLISRLSALIEHAREIVAIPAEELEAFVQQVDVYLETLELWREDVVSKTPPSAVADLIRAKVGELQTLHAEVLQRADSAKERVRGEIGDVQRRASVLKSYVDTLPSRISLVGKKEG